MRGCFFYAFFLIFPLLHGCTRDKGPDAVPLAVVNGEPVTVTEVRKGLSSFLRRGPIQGEKPGMELKTDFLNSLVEKKLMEQEARALNITVSDADLERKIDSIRKDYPEDAFNKMIVNEFVNMEDWKKNLRSDLLLEKVIDRAVGSAISVGDKDAREYYDSHPEEYIVEEQVRARQITVRSEEEARDVLKRLRKGEDFAAVAGAVSLSPDREAGGDMGYFPRGQMPPEFDEACFSLPPGRLSGVVRSSYGYHIFLVEDKRQGGRLDFKDVRKKVLERIIKERKEQAFSAWMKDLKGKARITVNTALLKEL